MFRYFKIVPEARIKQMLLEMNLQQKGLDQPKISFHKIMNFLEPKFGPT